MSARCNHEESDNHHDEGEGGSKDGKEEDSASQLIDARIKELGDWRGETLARVRTLIREVDPDVVEEWKWRGVPVWSHAGIICTGETYKNVVKLTFFKGASAFETLIRAAVALNTMSDGTPKGRRKTAR